ncbi:unnamed protein product [Dovyalis caffra]|uniref:Sema domain-containing protein n=1 Tax=Dovyalis caffra TaxID=77055 RepID=A0AAV1SB63_9ROSI|nr:unnamed protein product [Dovyalis caffra]
MGNKVNPTNGSIAVFGFRMTALCSTDNFVAADPTETSRQYTYVFIREKSRILCAGTVKDTAFKFCRKSIPQR